MSKTVLTNGWPAPSGNCDICRKEKAKYWFGDTSVALCGSEMCKSINQRNWDLMLEELDEDE